MRSTRRALGLGLALTALCGGVLAVPVAATAKSPATSKNKERKQNKKIGTASAQAKQAAAAIPVLAAQLGTVNSSLVQVVTDLGSPKQVANNVNFLIAVAGALANDVNALKSVDATHNQQIAQLQKQTILATQLAVGGTNQGACFGESPPLPTSKNAQTLSMTCLVSSNGAVTLPASCRSNKTNGGDCLRARVLSYDVETNPGGVVSDAVVGQEKTLTQRNALTNSDASAARQLMPSDSNTTDLLSGVTVQPIAGASSSNPVVVHLTISAFDTNPDTSGNAPLTP